MKRNVVFVSDHTAITAELLGRSLLVQFETVEFERTTLRFVNSIDKARAAAERIDRLASASGSRPLVFSTLIDPQLREIVAASDCVFFDFFDVFIGPLEQELEVVSSHTAGRSHGIAQPAAYAERIAALNFALRHDDGATTRDYGQAEMVLVGVSRSGKTPTCLYLALHYGVYAANFPLTEDDLGRTDLPESLQAHRDKVVGLTIAPERLQQIRQERRPDSRYASLGQCQYEVRQAEALYRHLNIPHLETTTMSVEEIAASLMDRFNGRLVR